MSPDLPPPLIAGHRGAGQTDARHARRDAATRGKPAENSAASILQAFAEGADFVEIDVVRSRDGHLIVTHSDRLSDHVSGPRPADHVGDLTLEELRRLPVGTRGDQHFPTLPEVLALAAEHAPKDSPIALNIEIKDTKGAGRPRSSVVPEVVRDVLAGPLPQERILISSFALQDLKEVHPLLPAANLGWLTDAHATPEWRIYPEGGDADLRYTHFSARSIDRAMREVPLTHLHPEIHTLNEKALDAVARHGLGVNTWGLKERQPARDRRAIERALDMTRSRGIPLGLITDWVPQMRAELSPMLGMGGEPAASGPTPGLERVREAAPAPAPRPSPAPAPAPGRSARRPRLGPG